MDADEQDEQRGRYADHEHPAPADAVEQQEVDEAGDEIAGTMAQLEDAPRPDRATSPGSIFMTRPGPRPLIRHPSQFRRGKRRTSKVLESSREARRKFQNRK